MKYFLFFIVIVTLIVCQPFQGGFHEQMMKRRKEKHEKILACINEKGSDNLKKYFTENKSLGFIKQDNSNLTEEDKNIFQECRTKVLMLDRDNIFSYRNRGRKKRYLQWN